MPTDTFDRPLRSLRISVTDRCNLRCTYCMPEQDYVWLPRDKLLRFSEIVRVVRACQRVGVDRVRLTGGEPLLRKDVTQLVAMIGEVDGIADLAMTTNAIALPQLVEGLAGAGLRRLTVSLDSLRRDRFQQLAGRDQLDAVLAGITAAAGAGLRAVKINTVVTRGGNDDEILELLAFGQRVGVEVRFIEYMDVGGATRWTTNKVVSCDEILARVRAHYGSVAEVSGRGSAPASRYTLPDGTVFGIVASTTQPFCKTCDRARLTADGTLYTCLYGRSGTDLRAPLRNRATDAQLADQIGAVWAARDDRGAEQRRELASRGPLAGAAELREDPHLEMHTRGG